jgi:hypothetical protein
MIQCLPEALYLRVNLLQNTGPYEGGLDQGPVDATARSCR